MVEQRRGMGTVGCGWSKDKDEPSISAEQEGIRRCVCDMALIMFHLVINSITFAGVDVKFAEKMLKWELKRFPNGVFFLFISSQAGSGNYGRGSPSRI